MLAGAAIEIESPADRAEVEAALRSVTADGPFVLAAVDRVGPSRHRCTFEVKRPGLVVGYRHVIDLQHRVDKVFHIVSAERRSASLASVGTLVAAGQ